MDRPASHPLRRRHWWERLGGRARGRMPNRIGPRRLARRRSCSLCCTSIPWVAIIFGLCTAAAVGVWYVYVERAQDGLLQLADFFGLSAADQASYVAIVEVGDPRPPGTCLRPATRGCEGWHVVEQLLAGASCCGVASGVGRRALRCGGAAPPEPRKRARDLARLLTPPRPARLSVLRRPFTWPASLLCVAPSAWRWSWLSGTARAGAAASREVRDWGDHMHTPPRGA